MPAPIVIATLQAAVLNGTSNILAQLLQAYRKQVPVTIGLTAVLQFVLFSLVNTPPNFLWLEFLEEKFPGSKKPLKQNSKDEKDTDQEDVETLDLQNTARKFFFDQTVGAPLNTIFYISFMTALKGMRGVEILETVREDFWPLTISGLKVWPLISILMFSVVPPHRRAVVGSIAAFFWGIYLSLRSS